MTDQHRPGIPFRTGSQARERPAKVDPVLTPGLKVGVVVVALLMLAVAVCFVIIVIAATVAFARAVL